MPSNNNAPQFPEKEVDNLIASYGRPPSKEQAARIAEMFSKEEARRKTIDQFRERKKERGKDQEIEH